jgi:NADH-quinone oxidoreductase subunit J
MADLIFGKYVWVFEVTSALLITAALGAMVLAHRERLTPKSTQRQLAARVGSSNVFVAGLPAPGVYARSQRGRHPGAAARRHAERVVVSPGPHRP